MDSLSTIAQQVRSEGILTVALEQQLTRWLWCDSVNQQSMHLLCSLLDDIEQGIVQKV